MLFCKDAGWPTKFGGGLALVGGLYCWPGKGGASSDPCKTVGDGFVGYWTCW